MEDLHTHSVAVSRTGQFAEPDVVGWFTTRLSFGVHKTSMKFCSQQKGVRPGTEPVGAIVAMTNAFEHANNAMRLQERTVALRTMTDAVWSALLPFIVAGLVLPTGCTDAAERTPHHVSFCVHGSDRSWLVAQLDQNDGILVSSGSACSTETCARVLHGHGVGPPWRPTSWLRSGVRRNTLWAVCALHFLILTRGCAMSHSHMSRNTMKEIRGQLIPALQKLLNALLLEYISRRVH